MEFEFKLIIEQDDWLSAIVETRCVGSDDRRPITVVSHTSVRFQNDKIVEMYNSFDSLSFFEQLDLLPSESLALLLSGTKIGSNISN